MALYLVPPPSERKPLSSPTKMLATKAYHKLGEISSKVPDRCTVYEEDDHNYYGSWDVGFGFIDVRFPKETTKKIGEV